jgi:phage terminase Nu1 subunit (DNA packaging protein)
MEVSPDVPARWSLLNAAHEFGVARETLRTALRQSSQIAGEDERYSTRQIVAALFGDLKAEKTGLTRAQREHWELENKQAAGILINVDEAIAMVHQFTFAIRQKILMSSLTDKEKNNLLLELQRIGEMDFTKMGTDEVEQVAS